MGDSSDSEEFYDAEEFTPIKGSKRSSLCKNINVTASSGVTEKEKSQKVESVAPGTGASSTPANDVPPVEDDRTTVKSVVQGRRRFQELRRCMQTEEDDEGVTDAAGSADQQTFTLEHPFK
ncbi:unnamed protein product [Arctia plantaginis]|nr:unnamed protein product [Arctia plantaginis]